MTPDLNELMKMAQNAQAELQRATEGELARTIGTLRQVRSARVHINVPRREPFAREAALATASIVLALRGGTELDKRQAEEQAAQQSKAISENKDALFR